MISRQAQQVIDAVKTAEPNIGSTDVSKCLPGWYAALAEMEKLKQEMKT